MLFWCLEKLLSVLNLVIFKMLVYALAKLDHQETETILSKIENKFPKESLKYEVVYGEYDLVIRLKAPSQKKMKELIDSLQETHGVKIQKTLVVTDKTRPLDNVVELS